MNEIIITSRSNPWVQQWLRYQSKRAERKAAGMAWLEGEHLVLEALNRSSSGHFSLERLVFPSTAVGKDMHQRLCSQFSMVNRINTVWLSDSVFQTLCTMDSAPAVCATVSLTQRNGLNTATDSLVLDANAPAVVLDGVQDPGNVGTLIRLCAAFAVPQVLLSSGCASAWSAKALRAGQGAQLAVRIYEEVDLNAAYRAFKRAQAPVAITSLAKGSVALNRAHLQPHMVWVFGNEGQGVSALSQSAATQTVHIPMQGGFESLNVASAAAICLWQWQQYAPTQGLQVRTTPRE